jgi:hypothetical protein
MDTDPAAARRPALNHEQLNYRCPQCGDPDHIDICAFVTVRLTSSGTRIVDNEGDIGADCWSSENGAGCDACGYEGAVKDFAPAPAGVVSLNEYRRRR